MTYHFRFRKLVAALAWLFLAGVYARAQGFGLGVTSSASSLLVSNSVTYTINVTNNFLVPPVSLQTTWVTNTLPASVQLEIASPAGYFTNYGTTVVFDVGRYFAAQFTAGSFVQLTLTVQPTVAGDLTNTVTVGSLDVTNIATTNIVIQVTNAPQSQADLAVSVAGPAQAVIANDWMTYSVTASNLGPADATGTVLTNSLPPGAILLGATPAGYTLSNSNLIYSLGTLAAGAVTNFQFTIQPTNAGALPLSAAIGSAVLDPNTTNNFADTNLAVGGYLATLAVFTNSPQGTNFLNGLLEQFVTVSNTNLFSVSAARVVVSGLTNRLFNAVGTNAGNPFVIYVAPSAVPLAAGQSVNLLLQYFPRRAFPFTNSQLQAFGVPMPDLTPPTATVGTNVQISRIIELPNGNMFIEWPAVTNRTYTVIYSDNVSFSNALIAPPSIVAPANDVGWIDYGPPATTSVPGNSTARFYRVLLNP